MEYKLAQAVTYLEDLYSRHVLGQRHRLRLADQLDVFPRSWPIDQPQPWKDRDGDGDGHRLVLGRL